MRNSGLVKLGYSNSISHKNFDAELIKHYTFKSGLGAHRPNSTTGFSLEYWLESSNSPQDLTLALEFNISLPSTTPGVLSLRPLISGGGVSEHRYDLSQEHSFSKHVLQDEGIICGARLVDGVTDFVLDIRSAKELSGMIALPIFHEVLEEEVYYGTKLLLLLPADKVLSDEKANNIFVSIQ